MTDRDELIEAGKQALTDAWLQGRLLSQDKPGGEWHKDFGKFAATVLDAVEEKVRADERDHGWQEGYDAGIAYAVEKYQHTWNTRLADLRAKVKALQTAVAAYGSTSDQAYGEAIAYRNVLALLDEVRP